MNREHGTRIGYTLYLELLSFGRSPTDAVDMQDLRTLLGPIVRRFPQIRTDVNSLLRLAEMALYAPHLLDSSHIASADAALERVRQALSSPSGPTRGLRAVSR